MDKVWMERLFVLGHALHIKFGDQICIAGGAVRNAFTDLPIKDLDIFFNDEAMVPHICDFLRLNILRDPLGCTASGSPYEDAGEFDGMKVWKCDEYAHGAWCHPVDLLCVPDIRSRISNFPDDISKFWIEGSVGMWRARPHALDNVNKKEVTYFAPAMRPARLARLKELYPSYAFFGSGNVIVLNEPVPLPKQAKRRAADPSYAPLWWDLPSPANPSFQTSCMDAVRDFCAPSRR